MTMALLLDACSEPPGGPATPYWVFSATAELQSDGANPYERCDVILGVGLFDGQPIPSDWEGTGRITLRRTRVQGGQITLDTTQVILAASLQWQKQTDGSASLVLHGARAEPFHGATTVWGATGDWECNDDTVAGGEGRRIQGKWYVSALYPVD